MILFECGCCCSLWGHAWGLTITQQFHTGNGEAEKTIRSRHCLLPPLTSCWNGFSTRTRKPLDCILKNNRIAASSPRSHFNPVIRWQGGMPLKVTSQQLLFFSFSPSLYSLSSIRSRGTPSNSWQIKLSLNSASLVLCCIATSEKAPGWELGNALSSLVKPFKVFLKKSFY